MTLILVPFQLFDFFAGRASVQVNSRPQGTSLTRKPENSNEQENCQLPAWDDVHHCHDRLDRHRLR